MPSSLDSSDTAQKDPPIGLAHLPTELYHALLFYLEQDADDYHDFRLSLLALSRAIPRAPLPLHPLFRCIVLRTPRQARKLYARLSKETSDTLPNLIKVFKYECYEADADIIVNLLKMLQSITHLTLFMGPNFAPEHLEDLFASPRTNLKYLSLRFRPYVQKATYLQFMKGRYFDSTLTYLSTWPRSSLPQLSIVQDPLDPSIAPAIKFAQPIVFFSLDPISVLSASSFASSLSSLRFRIPSRSIVPHLHRYQRSLPTISFLDIATCTVTESQLEALLVDLPGLRMLILDECPIVSQRVDAFDVAGPEALEQWRNLGKTLALIGVKRAREKEKKIKKWIEEHKSATANQRSGGARQSEQPKAKKGRKGIANATFMIRSATKEETDAAQRPSVLSNAATSKSKNTSVAKQSQTATAGVGGISKGKQKPRGNTKKKLDNFRITPSPPSLRALSITAPMVSAAGHNFTERYAIVRKEFEDGWTAGIRQLTMIRDRMRATWHTGTTRVLVNATQGGSGGPSSSDREDVSGTSDLDFSGMSSEELDRRVEFKDQLKILLTGLEDAPSPETFEFDLNELECPLLCLAGPERGGYHPAGCPHATAWELWDDGF